MKKWFKNLICILCFVFFIKNSTAQNSITIGNYNYNSWELSNEACYGCGSFYVMVVNNGLSTNGYYYYDIYFWSNSFYTNGYAANTYVKPVTVYAVDPNGRNTLMFNLKYVVVQPKSNSFNGYFYVGYVYSTSANQKIKISWSNASAW
jgi:hypothetical protein